MEDALASISPSRGHKKRERTRGKLVAAALRVFARKGEALTISDVVAAAEVSNGTFYNYFADREALFDALAEHLASTLAAEAAIEIDTGDSALRFVTASARVLAHAAEDPTWGALILRLDALGSDAQENATRYLREDLEQGRAEGRFEVGADAAILDFVGGALGVAIRRIVQGDASREHVVTVLSRLLRALGVPSAEILGLVDRALVDAGLQLD